jgi:hypothetical protein
MAHRIRRATALAVAGLTAGCFVPLTCGSPAPVRGKFGMYHAANMILQLPTGDTITLYRVKYWRFSSGELPALQFEYASRVSTSDTDAVIAMDRVLWPAVAPYVEHLNLSSAILTATVLSHPLIGSPGTTTIRSYGVTVEHDLDGLWRLNGHPEPLAPADSSGVPSIVMPDKRPLAFMTTPPQQTE